MSHPKNHCVPINDILSIPGDETSKIIVMPLLRLFDSPPFETVGEAIEAFRQLIEVCLRAIAAVNAADMTRASLLAGDTIHASMPCGTSVCMWHTQV